MACCKSKRIVDKTLRKFFYWLGSTIGQSPWYFIIVPVLITALLATGMYLFIYWCDTLWLYSYLPSMLDYFFLLYYCDRLFTWMLRHLFFLVRVVYKYYQLISTNFNFSDQKHWLPSSSRIWEKSWQKSKWLWTQCNV